MRRVVENMGLAAYMKMQGFKIIGRKGRSFHFELSEDDDANFDQLSFEYANSVFHTFDVSLMSLKTMPNYVPPEKVKKK